jgi:large conductance mechanosensitive channel
MKKFASEFRQFIMRGNVLDLAVGVVIGGAFQKIVSSLVTDIVFPAISPILGGVNFSDWKWGPVMIGNFVQATVDFLIIALFVFIVVRIANRLKKETPEAPKIPEEIKLLTEIRDLLKEPRQ